MRRSSRREVKTVTDKEKITEKKEREKETITERERPREREVTLGELPFRRHVVVLVGKPCHWVSP